MHPVSPLPVLTSFPKFSQQYFLKWEIDFITTLLRNFIDFPLSEIMEALFTPLVLPIDIFFFEIVGTIRSHLKVAQKYSVFTVLEGFVSPTPSCWNYPHLSFDLAGQVESIPVFLYMHWHGTPFSSPYIPLYIQ